MKKKRLSGAFSDRPYRLSLYVGNLHLNVAASDYSPEAVDLMEPYVFEWTGKAASCEASLSVIM